MDVHFPEGMVFTPTGGVQKRPKHRLHLRDGDTTIRIEDMWKNGFSTPITATLPRHGFIDLFDGAKHLFHALVVASGEDKEHRYFEFKITRDAALGLPRDFEAEAPRPVALIPHYQRAKNV